MLETSILTPIRFPLNCFRLSELHTFMAKDRITMHVKEQHFRAYKHRPQRAIAQDNHDPSMASSSRLLLH